MKDQMDARHNGQGERQHQERLPAAMRQARIVAAFEKNGFASIATLAEELNVSGMTIRRDMSALARRGLLERTHGGAIPPQPRDKDEYDVEEPDFDQRMRIHPSEKSAIAMAAAKLVAPGESLGLDVGTSILALAQQLAQREGLRVFTNNLRVGMALGTSRNDVYMLGGRIRSPELSLIGPQAVGNLHHHFLDKVFIGVSGVDANGLYDYSPEDTEVKQAMIENAQHVVVLCDSSKFGRRALSRVAPFESIDTFITDDRPPPDIAAALHHAGTRVIIV